MVSLLPADVLSFEVPGERVPKQTREFSNSRPPGLRLKYLLLVSCAALALTGCAPNIGGFSVLDRAEQPADALPDKFQDFDGENVADFSTARYIAEHNGTKVWFTRDTSGTGVCFLAYADDAVTATTCVTPEGPLMVGTSTIDFYLVPDGKTGPDNATKVSENLYANG